MRKILFLALCALSLFSCNDKKTTEDNQQVDSTAVAPTTDTIASTAYHIGSEAADFSLKNVDDKQVSLADFSDAKGYIVVFTCNHCPYAIAYEDRIADLNRKYAGLGYPVIAINPNNPAVQPEDSFELMKARVKEKNITYPYLFDEGQKVYPQYGATKTPHVFVLNKENGKNIVKYIGAIDNNYENPNDVSEKYVEDAVNALISGKQIAKTNTVAIGCTIKV